MPRRLRELKSFVLEDMTSSSSRAHPLPLLTPFFSCFRPLVPDNSARVEEREVEWKIDRDLVILKSLTT